MSTIYVLLLLAILALVAFVVYTAWPKRTRRRLTPREQIGTIPLGSTTTTKPPDAKPIDYQPAVDTKPGPH
jgi:hypothetical protein